MIGASATCPRLASRSAPIGTSGDWSKSLEVRPNPAKFALRVTLFGDRVTLHVTAGVVSPSERRSTRRPRAGVTQAFRQA